MQKSITLALRISKELDKNWQPELEAINLHKIFSPVYSLDFSFENMNVLIAFIILAFDNDSQWLNLKQDRYENKVKILKSLTDDVTKFDAILTNENSEINDVIADYLKEQANWKFQTILTLLDYHSNMIRFANQKTEQEKSVDKLSKEGTKQTLSQDYDIDVITKVNKQKGELLEQAIAARKEADKLLSELKKEFVQLDHAVQGDFGFEITDEKKIDPMSWREFIRHKVIPARKTTQS